MEPLVFLPVVAKEKPTNADGCPFCAKETLEKIIDQSGEMIWLDNKYRTLESTMQTIVIESDQHEGDISTYSYDYNRSLFHYVLSKSQEMNQSGRYQSVGLYKNFGRLSGGSLRHPHMQIIGFEKEDIYADITSQHFEGLTVLSEPSNLTITISTKPIMGFCEFNVIISDHAGSINDLADGVKEVVTYLLTDYFNGRCNDYNLFFYHLNQQIICKIVPRFIVSPYFVGYKIPQVAHKDRLLAIKKEFLNRHDIEKNKRS